MNKNYIISGLAVLCMILTYVTFRPAPTLRPVTDYNLMTAGQLLDVKIGYDEQISGLDSKRQTVIELYNKKRGILIPTQPKQPTGDIEQMDSFIKSQAGSSQKPAGLVK